MVTLKQLEDQLIQKILTATKMDSDASVFHAIERRSREITYLRTLNKTVSDLVFYDHLASLNEQSSWAEFHVSPGMEIDEVRIYGRMEWGSQWELLENYFSSFASLFFDTDKYQGVDLTIVESLPDDVVIDSQFHLKEHLRTHTRTETDVRHFKFCTAKVDPTHRPNLLPVYLTIEDTVEDTSTKTYTF